MSVKPVRERISCDKKSGHIAVSRFRLGVSHLFDRHTFALLAFDDLFRCDTCLSELRIADDQFHELGVIGGWVVEQ